VGAQDKATKKSAGAQNIQGKVVSIAKDTSTITVAADSPGGGATRVVTFSASTKFLYGHSDDNKAGTLDKVQTGTYISCSGAMAKGAFMATECVYRETK